MIDGHITGRWILSDEDPAAGTLTFTPVLPHRTILTPPGTTGIVSTPIQRTLDEAGYLPITPIAIGRYRVTYDLTVDGGWPSHEIEVTEAHTLEAPLWIPTASPVPTGPGLVQVVSETARIAAEIAASHAALEASRAETAALSAWEAVDSPGRQGPRGPEGPQGPPGEVTLAALTTALAGKITGPGLTLRLDTTVGTRVLLDHPNGTLMLSGDTGWRARTRVSSTGDVAGEPLPTGIEAIPGTTGTIAFRRTNNQIYLSIAGLKLSGAPQIQVPAIFRGTAPYQRVLITSDGVTGYALLGGTTIYLAFNGSTNVLYGLIATFVADPAWTGPLPYTPL